jgi:rRNA-processing protein FCF1
MNQYDLLKKLARQCLKKPPFPKNFPKEENKQLAVQIKKWLEQYGTSDNPKYHNEIRVIRDFLLLHEAASQGHVPVLEEQPKIRFYLVIDTNIFFHDEKILSRLNEYDIFVLPQIVLDELCNLAKNKDLKGKKSQRILTYIRQFPTERLLQSRVDHGDVYRFLPQFQFHTATSNDECDHQILAVTMRFLSEKKPAQLLSNDFELRKKAAELGITALSLQEFLTGR